MQKTVTIIDNVWGTFTIDNKFAKMLPLISDLKYKRQLGLTCLNPEIIGGNHSRYEHSIGVLYVSMVFIDECQRFKKYFPISEMDINAFCLSGLFHDVGHGPYSHAFERLSKTSHEVETIKKVLDLKSQIDDVFGENMCDRVVAILENSYSIKKRDDYKTSEKLDLVFVLSALMSGAIDIDRMDYLSRDLLNVHGTSKDFCKIFTYMELELVNDAPKIVFDQGCIPLLEDFFLTRFRNYNEIYFQQTTNILDEYFKKFLIESFDEDQITSNFQESDVEKRIKDGPHKSFLAKRCSEVLQGIGFESILYKAFQNKSEMNVFVLGIKSIIDLNDFYSAEILRNVVIYDSRKNNVLIKSGEKVFDFSEVSKVIKDKIAQETLGFFVDIELLKFYLLEKIKMSDKQITKVIKGIKRMFNTSNYEVEKKFLFNPENLDTIINVIDLKEGQTITNTDDYFSYLGMNTDISIRERKGEEYPYTIKLPATDSTSLTKRQELQYGNDISLECFLLLTKEVLAQNGYTDISSELEYDLTIITERKKFVILINDSKIEVALDFSKYIRKGLEKSDYMIELELKEGNGIDLWFIVEKLKQHCVLESCNDSKYSRASNMLKRTFEE